MSLICNDSNCKGTPNSVQWTIWNGDWWSKARIYTVANLAVFPHLAALKPQCCRHCQMGDTYAGSMPKTGDLGPQTTPSARILAPAHAHTLSPPLCFPPVPAMTTASAVTTTLRQDSMWPLSTQCMDSTAVDAVAGSVGGAPAAAGAPC
eukprot:scaffold17251_cov20-Tisochrysis_lutea.AAC.1